MSIAPYIKTIGRGKEGARALSTAEAKDLLAQVLDDKVTDLEVGAFCLAMRIKGETTEELDGFLQASHERCIDLSSAAASATRGVVVLPSYNGSRKLPNLTPLLAAGLTQRGVHVLIHGMPEDPTRVTSAQVFEALHWPVVKDASSLTQAWQRGLPAFMDLNDLCPSLARLLNVRWTIGLRNPGHTIAKLLNPFWRSAQDGICSMQVINYTHPEYAVSLRGFATHIGANALLMRGTEGEPVADARRQPRCDVFLGGVLRADLSLAPEEGVLTSIPALPQSNDAQTTARYIQDVQGGRQTMPRAIEAQIQTLIQALEAARRPESLDT
jgi:anthranilate phosphoribosyltransferase